MLIAEAQQLLLVPHPGKNKRTAPGVT